MKTLILILMVLLAWSCEKIPLNLTGTWDLVLIMQGNDTIYYTMSLVQNDNNTIAGNIIIVGEEKILLSTSKIKNDSVIIDCLWNNPAILSLKGKRNSNFNNMNGTYYSDGDYVPGTWLANKK
jgi:hypothetical protein